MRWWWWQIIIVIIEQERWHVLEKNLLEFAVKEKWKYKIKKETKRKKTKHSKEVDLAGVGNDDVW